jgi:hypothetical protein
LLTDRFVIQVSEISRRIRWIVVNVYRTPVVSRSSGCVFQTIVDDVVIVVYRAFANHVHVDVQSKVICSRFNPQIARTRVSLIFFETIPEQTYFD